MDKATSFIEDTEIEVSSSSELPNSRCEEPDTEERFIFNEENSTSEQSSWSEIETLSDNGVCDCASDLTASEVVSYSPECTDDTISDESIEVINDENDCSTVKTICDYDMIDGIGGDMIDGIGGVYRKCTIYNTMTSEKWIPSELKENAGIRAIAKNLGIKYTAWRIAYKNDLFIFEFHSETDDKKFQVTVNNRGRISLTKSKCSPAQLTVSDAKDDPRVFRYFRSNKLGENIMQPLKYPKRFVVIRRGYVVAIETTEKHATTWGKKDTV